MSDSDGKLPAETPAAGGLPVGEFATFEHEYITKYIELADQKAGAIGAICTAALAYSANEIGLPWLTTKSWVWLDCLSASATFFLILGGALSLVVVTPRLGGKKEGLIYFGAIAERETSDQYAIEVAAVGDPTRLNEIVKHCHEIAKVAKRKYSTLRSAFFAAGFGLLLFLLDIGLRYQVTG